ncbi:MAG: hypothetical protein F9B45_08180 [Phycisphaera sp. RhM]|nr:hypothetical protein [Phycisphaera sp. RhM]
MDYATEFLKAVSARKTQTLNWMPIALIQEMVRHRSRSTTERYYVGDLSGKIDFDESKFGDQS